jgi:hypothetical protein
VESSDLNILWHLQQSGQIGSFSRIVSRRVSQAAVAAHWESKKRKGKKIVAGRDTGEQCETEQQDAQQPPR